MLEQLSHQLFINIHGLHCPNIHVQMSSWAISSIKLIIAFILNFDGRWAYGNRESLLVSNLSLALSIPLIIFSSFFIFSTIFCSFLKEASGCVVALKSLLKSSELILIPLLLANYFSSLCTKLGTLKDLAWFLMLQLRA